MDWWGYLFICRKYSVYMGSANKMRCIVRLMECLNIVISPLLTRTEINIKSIKHRSIQKYEVHQSSASLAFVKGIHRWPVNSPYKRPVTLKCFHLMASSWMTVWTKWPISCWRHFLCISRMKMFILIQLLQVFLNPWIGPMMTKTYDVILRQLALAR